MGLEQHCLVCLMMMMMIMRDYMFWGLGFREGGSGLHYLIS